MVVKIDRRFPHPLYKRIIARSTKITAHDEANDAQPMWHGSTLYFLSDRDDKFRSNIWAYELDTDTVRQVTHFEDFDIHFPAIGPSDMVFENGGGLYVMDLETETARQIEDAILTRARQLRIRDAGL